MGAMASGHRGLVNNQDALAWTDRLLPIAERLGLLDDTIRGLIGRGTTLLTVGRPREGMIVMRGVHQLTIAQDIRDLELNTRVLMTFFEQWGEPAAGLALGREGLEIGRRLGSRAYGFQMVGNSSICAFRVGEWDSAAALIDEWLAIDAANPAVAEFYVDRAILRALRGEDAMADVEEANRSAPGRGGDGPPVAVLRPPGACLVCLLAGRHDEVRSLGSIAIDLTSYFAPLTYPLLIRSALWSSDAAGAAGLLAAMDASGYRGPVLTADGLAARAGIDALEGRSASAVAGYREAMHAYRQLGLVFEEATAAVDMATLFAPEEREAPDIIAAVAAARVTLERLGARPFLERLDRMRPKEPAG